MLLTFELTWIVSALKSCICNRLVLGDMRIAELVNVEYVHLPRISIATREKQLSSAKLPITQ